MNRGVSPIWLAVPSGIAERVQRCVGAGVAGAGRRPEVYFRADDVAVPGRGIERLMDIFTRRRLPLNPALVPAWLTQPRWRSLQRMGSRAAGLWCWHQHGWRHENHEPTGKKQEFGDARQPDRVRLDLVKGRDRLEALLGAAFTRVFTPPWNRCGEAALRALADSDFTAVSRTDGSLPPAPAPLCEFPVHVDLHTMKITDARAGWRRLLADLHGGLAAGRCGVMIHHQRMNAAAFSFLDLLLGVLAARKVPVLRFDEL